MKKEKGRYTYYWRGPKPIYIEVISVSLESARKLAYKQLREQEKRDLSKGELWTISVEDKGDPLLSNKKSGVSSVYTPGFPGILPPWWLEKMRSGWPKTRPFTRYL